MKDSSRQASEYLSRIKRESEEAASLRHALDEEREAVAERFASLDKEAAKRERERQAEFDRIVQRQVGDFEKRARELVAQISDRADRLKVEREAQRQTAEMKREAQRAARAASVVHSANTEPDRRGVRIVRDGQLVSRSSGAADDIAADEPTYVSVAQREIQVGDKVKLRSFGSVGIVDQIKGDAAEVRVKALRFREKLENLELVEQQSSPKPQEGKLEKLRRSSGTEVHLKDDEQGSRSEINVIGKTTDEAVDLVDKFLDEASLASVSEVRIVHGHGTGALRRAIGDLLKGHPHVGKFIAAPQDQGGTGATIVQLRGNT